MRASATDGEQAAEAAFAQRLFVEHGQAEFVFLRDFRGGFREDLRDGFRGQLVEPEILGERRQRLLVEIAGRPGVRRQYKCERGGNEADYGAGGMGFHAVAPSTLRIR